MGQHGSPPDIRGFGNCDAHNNYRLLFIFDRLLLIMADIAFFCGVRETNLTSAKRWRVGVEGGFTSADESIDFRKTSPLEWEISLVSGEKQTIKQINSLRLTHTRILPSHPNFQQGRNKLGKIVHTFSNFDRAPSPSLPLYLPRLNPPTMSRHSIAPFLH